jgi:dienelactone hydrolase
MPHPLRAFVLSLGLAAAAGAADAPPVEAIRKALGAEIIGPRQAHADTRAFVEERLPAPPAAKTAGEWEATANALRRKALDEVVFRGAAAGWRDAPLRVEWGETIEGGPGYRIRKLRYEALPRLWIPALLYEPSALRPKMPVVLNVNGHDSKGKAADYKQIRCINLAKRGVLALNVEWFGMGQLRAPGYDHGLLNAIDLCGTSGIATQFLMLTRGIDVLLAHPNADPQRVGVTGLSGGGWQTIFVSGLDPRVTLSVPVAGYSGFATRTRHASDLGDSEQTPCDLATVLDYTHLTAMRAPRPTLLVFNAKDNCCFAAPHALPPLLEVGAPLFGLFGAPGNLRSHVNQDPGDHNYLLDNRQALYQAVADFWTRPGEPVLGSKEIPSEAELKSAEAMTVEMPADALDFQKLATELARDLPRDATPPEDAAGARAWQDRKRMDLMRVVRPDVGELADEAKGAKTVEGVKVTRHALRVAGAWSVPAVELAPGSPKGAAIVLADEGRAAAAEAAAKLVADGQRVLVLDPWYFGEAKVVERDWLWGLMLGTVGERPLGVQAGQVLSVARWWSATTGAPVRVAAIGPRTGLIALTAAALEPKAIAGLTLHRPMGSLKEAIEEGRPYLKSPEVFCFGLLEVADLRQLAALVAPRPVELVEPGERARRELDGLDALAKRLGAAE